MRVVVIVFAALITLGLAAFGVVAAQRAAGPDSLIALAVHVISPGQSNNAAPASQPVPAQAARPTTPVTQVPQTTSAAQPSTAAPTTLTRLPPGPRPPHPHPPTPLPPRRQPRRPPPRPLPPPKPFPLAIIPTPSVCRASLKSTPAAGLHSGPSTSSNTTSCATKKSC